MPKLKPKRILVKEETETKCEIAKENQSKYLEVESKKEIDITNIVQLNEEDEVPPLEVVDE